MKNNKLLIILTNLLNSNFAAIANFLISFTIIKFNTSALWGELIYYMSLVQVVGVVISWGSKDYLLKEFSLNPSGIVQIWQENVLTRLFLFLFAGVLFGFLFPLEISLFLFLWILVLLVNKSYDVFIYYHKSFIFSLLTEILTLIVLIFLILINKDYLNISYLLISYVASGIFRSLLLIVYFKMDYKLFFKREISLNNLRYSSSFFLLALVGILNSKVDIFCINYSMSKSDLGNYQVFFTFLMLIQNLGYLFVEPFAKNLYRLKAESLNRIKGLLVFIGPIISFILIGFAYLIITFVYGIFFNIWNYIFGFLFCLPIFRYSLNVYKLFKFNHQQWVVYISIICLAINIMLDLTTIPYWGILGVVVSGMVVQWSKLFLFIMVDNLLFSKLKEQKSVST